MMLRDWTLRISSAKGKRKGGMSEVLTRDRARAFRFIGIQRYQRRFFPLPHPAGLF
jgi:hypothetical protein